MSTLLCAALVVAPDPADAGRGWQPRPLTYDLSVSCRFAIGRAQKVERSLRLKDDPADSVWLVKYCRWVAEARDKNCGRLGPYLRYVKHC